MKARLNWMSMMGGTLVDIDALVDPTVKTVKVEADTLATMAESILREGPVDVEGNIDMAHAILSVKADHENLYDVTEVGGGWAQWTQDIDLEPKPEVCIVHWKDGVTGEWVEAVGGLEDDEVEARLRRFAALGRRLEIFAMNIVRLTGNIGDVRLASDIEPTHIDAFLDPDRSWGECECGHPLHLEKCTGTLRTISDGDTAHMMMATGMDGDEPCVCSLHEHPAIRDAGYSF